MSKYISFLFLLLSFSACQQNTTADSKTTTTAGAQTVIKNIDIKTFAALMQDENKVILDVRTPEEIAEGMVEGAVHIDFYADDFDNQIAALDKSKEYLVYCKSGGRSAKAAKKMQAAGFASICNVKGGYKAWSAK